MPSIPPRPPKGRPKPPGSGRKKGQPNHNTTAVKDMLRAALDQVGGAQYLADQALENPAAFLSLVGKLIPNEVKTELAGKDGGPITIKVVTGVSVDLEGK